MNKDNFNVNWEYIEKLMKKDKQCYYDVSLIIEKIRNNIK